LNLVPRLFRPNVPRKSQCRKTAQPVHPGRIFVRHRIDRNSRPMSRNERRPGAGTQVSRNWHGPNKAGPAAYDLGARCISVGCVLAEGRVDRNWRNRIGSNSESIVKVSYAAEAWELSGLHNRAETSWHRCASGNRNLDQAFAPSNFQHLFGPRTCVSAVSDSCLRRVNRLAVKLCQMLATAAATAQCGVRRISLAHCD